MGKKCIQLVKVAEAVSNSNVICPSNKQPKKSWSHIYSEELQFGNVMSCYATKLMRFALNIVFNKHQLLFGI